MFLTERIEKAIVRATVLHHFQKRKISGVPYIVHPYSVAFLLAHYVDDEDVIIAGLLHDVLEDTPEYTEALLREEFGERVLRIVKEVTEDYSQAEKLNHLLRGGDHQAWKTRKERYLENLANDSEEALLVATADKVHNMRNIIDEHATHGNQVWAQFRRRPDELLWFYTEANRVISEHLKHPLVIEMSRILEELKRIALEGPQKTV
ncbi:MAG: HD domain-containing protein [Undibacterium sp.]